jgi:hypothetical protein
MTIEKFDRVYVSCVGEYGRVSEIINTGIVGIVKYRVEFEPGEVGRSGIFGAAFVQPALAKTRSRAPLRLAAVDGVQVSA